MALEGRLPTESRSWVEDWQIEAPDTHTKSTTSRLVKECIAVSRQILRRIKANNRPSQATCRAFEKSHSELVLWDTGYGVSEGKLDEALGRSRTLARSLLNPLVSISLTMTQRVIPLVTSGKKSIIHQTLDDITAEAKTVLHIDLEGSSDGEDSESDLSFESQSDDGWDDILEDLATDVQCLIDLDSLIQCPAPEIKERRGGRGKAKVAPDWEPYRPYSDMIAHRFPEAAVSLVDRLARANWERFQRTNAVREENIAAAAAAQAQETAPADAAAVIVSGTRAQSSAATVSKFNDSGLGDSVRTGSTYADTVMSYRAQGQESVRVPPLPDGAKQGEPFNCIACSQQVIITNNSAWKHHLYRDLCPWICHDVACQYGNKLFDNRKDWIDHLALGHDLQPGWRSFRCPLCRQETGDGKIAICRHLSSHMEEISLAALPVGADEGFEDDNRDSDKDGSVSSDLSDLSKSTGTKDTGINKVREVLETQRGLLGPDHPDTLASMTRLASTYWNQGRLDEAHKLELQVLAARTGVIIEVDKTASMGDETQRVFYIAFRHAIEDLGRAASKDANLIIQAGLYDVLRYCDPLTVKLALLSLPPGFSFPYDDLDAAVVSNENYGGSVASAFLDTFPHPVMLTPEIKRCICQNEKSGREVWDVISAKQPKIGTVYPDFDALMLEAGARTIAGGDGAQPAAPSLIKTPDLLGHDDLETTDDWLSAQQQWPDTTPPSLPLEPMQRSMSNSSILSTVSAASLREQNRGARRRQEVLDQGRRSILALKPQDSPQDAPGPKSRLTEKPAPSRHARRKQAKVFCKDCDEYPNGFRGAHELQRHINSKHWVTVTKWICRDPASVGIDTMRPVTPLEGCKNCESKKQYGADYNAAAHLRRAHFSPKTLHKKDDRKGGRAGWNYPPMDTLKLWLEEVIVEQVEPRVYREGGSEAPPSPGDSQSMPPTSVELTRESPGKEPLEHSEMQSSSAASSDQVYEEIHVPHSAIGLIMGESGEAIKQLQHTTGCKVKVIQMPDALPENAMREIALIGSHDSIMLAKQAIGDKVSEVEAAERRNTATSSTGPSTLIQRTSDVDNTFAKPFFGRQPAIYAAPKRSASAPLICFHKGCNAKPFNRPADLERHYIQIHGSDQDKNSWFCDYVRCNRLTSPFHRMDHCREHFREFHREDIAKRGIPLTSEWCQERNIKSSWWRCDKCLARVDIAESGFRCPTCAFECPSIRQQARGY